MVWIAITGLVAIGVLLWTLLKVNRLNDDPVQKELAHLILEMMANGATTEAQTIFVVSSTRAMMMGFVNPRERHTRLAHALSIAKPMLNAHGYEVAKGILRSIA